MNQSIWLLSMSSASILFLIPGIQKTMLQLIVKKSPAPLILANICVVVFTIILPMIHRFREPIESNLILLIVSSAIISSIFAGAFGLIFMRYGGKLSSNKNAKFRVIKITALSALLSVLVLLLDHNQTNAWIPIGIFASIIAGFWQLDSAYGTKWRHVSNQTATWIESNDPMVRFRLALHIINEMNEMHLLGHKTLGPVSDNLRGYLVSKILEDYFETINENPSLYSSLEKFRSKFSSNDNLISFLLPSDLDVSRDMEYYHHEQEARRLIIQHINNDRLIIEKILLERAALGLIASKLKIFGDPQNTLNLLEKRPKKSS